MKTIRWGSVALGAAVFGASHVVVVLRWQTWFDGGAWAPWFLNDGGRAILFTACCLFVAALAAGLLWARSATDAIVHGVNVAAGAAAAMAFVLVAFVGMGTIFPIVLASGATIALLSTFLASVLVAIVKPRST
jgi:hypothetical protein